MKLCTNVNEVKAFKRTEKAGSSSHCKSQSDRRTGHSDRIPVKGYY